MKNNYYLIKKDNEIYAYISVKKDFFTEGFLVNDNTFLSGYFNFYDEIILFVWDNNLKEDEYIKGLSIKSDTNESKFDINGNISKQDYRLYKADIDSNCYIFERYKISDYIEITHIVDDNLINNINYNIRQSKRNLNNEMKKYSVSFERSRLNNLRELLCDMKQLNINNNIKEDLNNYLDVLKDKYYPNKTPQKTKKRKNISR